MANCEECDAECCRYVTTIIDAPENAADWDEIRWLLIHKGVSVYVDEDGDWNVEVPANCKYLDEETKKCGNYENRPQVCRDHGTHECEENDDAFDPDICFESEEDLDEYLKEHPIKENEEDKD